MAPETVNPNCCDTPGSVVRFVDYASARRAIGASAVHLWQVCVLPQMAAGSRAYGGPGRQERLTAEGCRYSR
jgi:hypothetical protein